ncbi:carbohydrate porin [Shewanella sp. YLB-07]|uniref:carbohydrate porin n=1 Tax=Shewanella sp. YLB-07 TaxID=2601268 RepID=UPI0018841144|nr:carbohydrate porin [Shewanella sp. YLB-07]
MSTTYRIDQWLPFFRAGYAEGDASLITHSITAGVGYLGLGGSQDSLNLGLGWGQPNSALFGDSDDQYTAEVFYKWHWGKHLTLSPNIQYLHTLPLNPQADDSWIMGLRTYFTL